MGWVGSSFAQFQKAGQAQEPDPLQPQSTRNGQNLMGNLNVKNGILGKEKKIGKLVHF